MLRCWQDKWHVLRSVDVMTTSTFVSGPTAHRWHSLQLKEFVNNEAIHSYHVSIITVFRTGWQLFVLLHITCWAAVAFGSMSYQLVLARGSTGSTALQWQVCLQVFDVTTSVYRVFHKKHPFHIFIIFSLKYWSIAMKFLACSIEPTLKIISKCVFIIYIFFVNSDVIVM